MGRKRIEAYPDLKNDKKNLDTPKNLERALKKRHTHKYIKF
jgi:hypothetical protein